uniref:Uncharacterized protein n=1 Tax=Sinocyclocheilus rhinocerous TaxID=307959 RepID=A0A673JES8_9TELE
IISQARQQEGMILIPLFQKKQDMVVKNTQRICVLLLNNNVIGVLADRLCSLLEGLLRLNLSRNRISFLSEGFSQGLGSLRDPSLAENRLTSLDSSCFIHFDTLQKFNLSHDAIKIIKMRTFGSMSTIHQLQLKNGITVGAGNGVDMFAFAIDPSFQELPETQHRLFLDNYDNLTCVNLDESDRNYTMVTVLVITVVAAIVMVEKKRGKKEQSIGRKLASCCAHSKTKPMQIM